MIGSWWIWWMVFMFFVFVTPVSYGWGYRGWGPPYPRHIQRRRAALASHSGSTAVTHQAWGWGGDFVWVMAVVGILWFSMSFWWR
jgi:hypothetical protein